MSSSPTTLRSPRRLRSALVAALALVAAAYGCATAERGSGPLTRARSSDDAPARALPGAPPQDARPTVDNLDPDLLAAVRAAAREAQEDGVRLEITSGWRSREHQQRLFDEAVAEYGSEEEARRYVSTPDVSAHVTGDAVDIGPTEADDWLNQHGAAYGLCQTFANEIWHFELATTPGGECPAMLPDGSYRG